MSNLQSVGFAAPQDLPRAGSMTAMRRRMPRQIASVLSNPMASDEARARALQAMAGIQKKQTDALMASAARQGIRDQKKLMKLQAAALDFQGPGAVEIGLFEREIVDLVRRNSILLARMRPVKASGQPHRYLEQTQIATGSFTDPRNIAPTATGPTRVEKYGTLKAIVAQSNLTQFDVAVTKSQGIFGDIEAQDIHDVASACIVTMAVAAWAGTDTSLSAPTTVEYMGLLTQITTKNTISVGQSIIDSLKAQVAALMANQTYAVKPTAIYINPILGDLIDREAKGGQIYLGDAPVAPGMVVRSINTQAGPLPLIPDPYIPAIASGATTTYGFTAPASGLQILPAVIVTEDLIQRPYMPVGYESPWPQLFQLGLTGNLQGQFVGVQYDCVIAKAASYAHAVVGVTRPVNLIQ